MSYLLRTILCFYWPHIKQVLFYHTGSKETVESVEEQFIEGVYTPEFLCNDSEEDLSASTGEPQQKLTTPLKPSTNTSMYESLSL